MGEAGRRMFWIWDKMQLIANFLRVRKAKAFGKKMEPAGKSPARRGREAMQKETDCGILALVLGESPCLQASAIQTLGAVRKHAAGVTHKTGSMDKDPGSQHFVTNVAT